MPFFKPSMLRSAAAAAISTTSPSSSTTRQAAQELLRVRSSLNALPNIPTCPTPTCPCADMPPDLDIDRSRDLNGTMAPYNEHMIVSSGQADWKSRIEDEATTAPWGALVANVKSALGLKGQFHNPSYNVVVSTSSFEASSTQSNNDSSRVLLFPSFKMIEQVQSSQEAIPGFVRNFLLPDGERSDQIQRSSSSSSSLSSKAQSSGEGPPLASSESWEGNVHPISSPTILICSHHSRDSRCGILGPLLYAEFAQYINKNYTMRNNPGDFVKQKTQGQSFASHPEFRPDLIDRSHNSNCPVNIGMISHIGGHKFAGNVIIYIPPDYPCRPIEQSNRGAKPKDIEQSRSSSSNNPPPHEDDPLDKIIDEDTSPLAGTGIWYGRVEPKHVEGIVEQTLGHGKIIKELFRGGIKQDGTMIRLPLYD